MNIDLSTGIPPAPERTRELAETLTELVRVLNHQTRHHEALGVPADADHLIRELSSAVSWLPQLLGQLSGWLKQEQEAGRIGVAPDTSYVFASDAVRAAELRIAGCRVAAHELQETLDLAASVTCDLTLREGVSDEGERG